jgi:hypothetical protein
MTAHVAIPRAKFVPLLDVLAARAWARAYLYAVGELSLHEAVDVLQRWAADVGLVAAIGQHRVQQIISDAFARVR